MKNKALVNRRKMLALSSAAGLTFSLGGCDTEESLKTDKTSIPKSDVIIIGAGLSGLNAAMLLEREGVKVTVLEGSNRIGGRIKTMDDLLGKPEAGGMQIGPMYARVLSTIEDLGLTTHVPGGGPPSLTLYIDGKPVLLKDWASSPLNKTVGPERNILPFALARHYVTKGNPLTDLESWLSPEAATFDVSYRDYLKGRGASDEAIRLIALTDHGANADTVSALYNLRKDFIAQFEAQNGAVSFLKGGMSRLPEAMANSLNGDVILGKKVVAIRRNEQNVVVSCADGSQFSATRAIVTVPFSVLRDVVFDPPLPDQQRQAVQELPYSQVTQIFYDIKEPFWEEDGMPGSMFSDGPLERTWTLNGPEGNPQHLWTFINGDGEKPLRTMSDEEVLSWGYASLRELRPSVEGRIEPRAVWSWSRNPFSKGAYAYFKPGQITEFRKQMILPAGSVHFAGEHTADLQAGMEAAMESGERAAYEVLDRLSSA